MHNVENKLYRVQNMHSIPHPPQYSDTMHLHVYNPSPTMYMHTIELYLYGLA